MPENITRELILQWAYEDVVIDLYESDDDGDAAMFQIKVDEVLTLTDILRLAADPACKGRWYFVNLLTSELMWIYRRSANLPFYFSRFRGIMCKEEYHQEVMKRKEEIYEVCLVLDSMRDINDPAIQYLYKQILDFRHSQNESCSKFHNECYSKLDFALFK